MRGRGWRSGRWPGSRAAGHLENTRRSRLASGLIDDRARMYLSVIRGRVML